MEDGKIIAVRDNGSSADIVARIDNANLAAEIMDKQIKNVSLRLVDGRTLSPEQQKKSMLRFVTFHSIQDIRQKRQRKS